MCMCLYFEISRSNFAMKCQLITTHKSFILIWVCVCVCVCVCIYIYIYIYVFNTRKHDETLKEKRLLF